MTRITELRAENIKRLQAVEVHPDGSIVVIAYESDGKAAE